MKYIIDVKDNKADALLEVLNGLSFVKTKPYLSEKVGFTT